MGSRVPALRFAICLFAALMLAIPPRSPALTDRAEAAGTTYYVSATGDDSRAGNSPETAWRSIGRVNVAPLGAGDTVAFEGGAVFDGKLYLSPAVQGTPDAPVTITSY